MHNFFIAIALTVLFLALALWVRQEEQKGETEKIFPIKQGLAFLNLSSIIK